MSAHDDYLARGEPGEAAAEEWEAMERWAVDALPDLDWDDDDAVQAAFDGPWREHVDAIEAAAEAEIEQRERGCVCRHDRPCLDDPAAEGCQACADQHGEFEAMSGWVIV